MIKDQLAQTIREALLKAKQDGVLALDAIPEIGLEKPKGKSHGDWATSVALGLASSLKMSPLEVAEAIVARLDVGGSLITDVEIAGPGFINLTLQPGWLYEILNQVEQQDTRFGTSEVGCGKRVLLEFVSANPNGPITVAHGRNAAIGDAVYALLTAVGFRVEREHYVNDALNSTQMNNFGKSVFVRYKQVISGTHDPAVEEYEWLYRGDYVLDIAKAIASEHGTKFAAADIDDPATAQTFRQLAQEGMQAEQQSDLEAFGVSFDSWYNESTLHSDGRVKSAINELTSRGHTYEKEGALWFKTTEYGDDKDRVLLRANGTATYLAGDVAYHKDKFERGYDRLIDVWGADHAGYVARAKASAAAMGYDPAKLDILLYQLVRIMKNGEFVKSSKRKGDVLYLKADLIDEIGKDAARFFFLMRSPNTDLDIDLDLAKKTEKDNPVYYVQYAHARIVQTLDKAKSIDGTEMTVMLPADVSLLEQDAEIDLIKKLSDFPDEVALAAADYAPQRVAQYARDLASQFHAFYDLGNRNSELRVVCENPDVRRARVGLVNATRIVLRNALHLLGVSAPDRM